MQKRTTVLILALMLALLVLIAPGAAVSQVGEPQPEYCKEVAFSTEEDFMSGDILISDGDLLGLVDSPTGGPLCDICARNADLLQWFDVTYDLGLDAADVINADANDFVVAFSTELDSPNQGQFTAGDLLITNVTIIPNQALTYEFLVNYDIGLDAVHFVGNLEDINGFLSEAEGISRDGWLDPDPTRLVGMLKQWNIDIWFSTEGTLGPVSAPGFLDGDLLSARDGLIVATNYDLLPDPEVPAGLPNRGVDFGLDAVTSDRSTELRRINHSTEILFEGGEIQFTDGDVMRYGNGVAAKNWDLIQCFRPEAKDLGLDALSVGPPTTRPCVSRITKIGGVDVADISLVDGMAFPGTVGTINAPVPFGGLIDIRGTICEDVQEFRVVYREHLSGNPWQPIPVLIGDDWKVKVDAFIPPGPDCLGQQLWYSNVNGWYSGPSYRHLSEAGLGGCNPGLALTVWDSDPKEELYDIVLETQTSTGVFSDTVRLVQLDNSAPETFLRKEAGVCNTVTSTPFMVYGHIRDPHFHSYQLRITGDGYGIHPYSVVRYYDPVPGAANLSATGTDDWANDKALHEVDLDDLNDPAMACGYSVLLRAWDRTMVCNFKFPTNQAYHCPGCRHSNDAWTFNYEPGSP